MRSLSTIGRVFYGSAIAGLGFQAIYFRDFPYMLIPSRHSWIPGLSIVAFVFGLLIILAGICIVFKLKTRTAALVLGTVLLLIFCFYFIPYNLFATTNYKHLLAWDNAGKELALAGGAWVITGSITQTNKTLRIVSSNVPAIGAILFCITMITFGVLHFLYAKGVSEYVPSWIPFRVFWTYMAGAGLLCSGIAILLNIKRRLAATLLGSMILIWVLILHIPYAIANPIAGKGGEITSALIALAYSGTAYSIAARLRQPASPAVRF